MDPADALVPISVVDALGEQAAAVPFDVIFGEDRSLALDDVFLPSLTLPNGQVHRALYREFDRTTIREAPIGAQPAPKALYDFLDSTATRA